MGVPPPPAVLSRPTYPRSVSEAVVRAPLARPVFSDSIELFESSELLKARRYSLIELAESLAEHFQVDVKTIEGMLFTLSANLGWLIDCPQGHTSIAAIISTWLEKEDFPPLIPALH